MKSPQKGFAPIIAVVIIVAVLAIGVGTIMYYQKQSGGAKVTENPTSQVSKNGTETLAKKVVNDYLAALTKKDFSTADTFIKSAPGTEILKIPGRTISFTVGNLSGTAQCSRVFGQSQVESVTCQIVHAKITQYEQGQEIGYSENSYWVVVPPENQSYLPYIHAAYPGQYVIINNNVHAQNFYKVQLSLNSGISKPTPYSFDSDYGASYLRNYLIDVLQLAKPVSTASFRNIISGISYDSTQKSPYGNDNYKFNREYFILLEPGTDTLDTEKIYKTKELTAMVSKAEPKLLPYIQNTNYCEVDADCSVSYNFCSYGSYNKFRSYSDIWGCASINYPQEDEKKLWAMCDATKQDPAVKYTGSKCISNKCIAQNREVVCKNGMLP